MSSQTTNWKALALLCTGFFLITLDSSIVLVALPSIGADLGRSVADLQWVMSAYMLGFGGLLLLGGRAGDLLGRRRIFIVGLGLLAVASLGAGLAGSATTLIAARAAQGVAAAVMAPAALSILMTTFAEGPERNRALGAWATTGALGGTAGSLIGGPITDAFGWEWIFLVSVPVAIAVALLSPRLLRESRAEPARRRFDVAGAATVTASLLALVYAVVEAPALGWGDPLTLGLFAVSALLAATFVAIESRSAAPLAPLRLFRSRAVVGGNLLLAMLGMMAFGMPFVLTQYAQEVLDWSPIQFGLAFVVMPLMVAVGSTIGQAVASRGGLLRVAIVGMALSGLGCLLLAQVPVDGSYLGNILPGGLVFGAGLGAAYVAGSIASLTGVAEADAGVASGLNNASFQIGGAVGVAILSTVAVSASDGPDRLAALTAGYQSAFAAAIAFAAIGLAVALLLLGRRAAAGVVGGPDAESARA